MFVCLSEFQREEKMFAEMRKPSSVTHSAVVISLPPGTLSSDLDDQPPRLRKQTLLRFHTSCLRTIWCRVRKPNHLHCRLGGGKKRKSLLLLMTSASSWRLSGLRSDVAPAPVAMATNRLCCSPPHVSLPSLPYYLPPSLPSVWGWRFAENGSCGLCHITDSV